MTKPKVRMREVHLVVAVTLGVDGLPVSARVEDGGGPWAYSDQPQTWTPETEKWAKSTDADANEAELYLTSVIIAGANLYPHGWLG